MNMQKWFFDYGGMYEADESTEGMDGPYYLASEVDARIAELEAALADALQAYEYWSSRDNPKDLDRLIGVLVNEARA
jgi:hypothetical protein